MKNVIIADKKEFERKKKIFSESGSEKIHVLSDFDKTLTKALYQGEKIGSLISRLRNGNYLTKEYAQAAHALFDTYHPIEIDSTISLEEKSKAMQEWWKKHKELLINSGVDRKTFSDCVKEMIETHIPELRDGALDFLTFLKNKKIPLIILSSSLEDLIKEFLLQKKINYENIHVVANGFTFDADGKAKGIRRIIHVFSKNEASLHTLPFYDELLPRKNIILLGDSIGDLGMVEGFPYECLLKIAFLNDKTEENLEEYKKQFDVVILNDGSFEFVNEFLRGMGE